MPSLADYDGKYIDAGKHEVIVSSARNFEYNSGSPGVEFEFKDSRGRTIKEGFVLVEKAYWRLAAFARACGLTTAELKRYDPAVQSCHQMLINKRLIVHVSKPTDKKYNEVNSWEPLTSTALRPSVPTPTPVNERMKEMTRTPTGGDDNTDDNTEDDNSIPF